VKIDVFLQRLEQEQARLAAEALKTPSGRDAFEYGRAAGMYAGMEHAKRVLIEMVAEQERHGYTL
jgi:hypothetical protein